VAVIMRYVEYGTQYADVLGGSFSHRWQIFEISRRDIAAAAESAVAC